MFPNRAGVSSIGTSSPNSGSTGNTNSTYGPGAYTSGVTNQGTATAYLVNDTDYQGYVLFNTASPVTVTLNGNVKTNFTCTIANIGTGVITLTPDSGYLINGTSSLTLGSQQGVQVFFADRAWNAFIGTSYIPILPVSAPAVNHEWLDSYDATSGAFTQTQPAFTDISGSLAASQLPTVGISVIITTAPLTSTGARGSMTFVNGQLTAQSPST
jgi:hypothetical protein